MDIPRQGVARKKKLKRYFVIALVVLAVPLITYLLSGLKPAPPSVDRGTVVIDAVKRGPLNRNVNGLGTLVPEDIRWIAAVTSGRVERRLVQQGAKVTPDTVLLELSNPELDQSVVEAESQLNSALAEYQNKKVELEAQLLNQQALAATVEADYTQAKLTKEANEQLVREGLVSDLILKQSRGKFAELTTRLELEKRRLAINTEAVKTQLAVSQARLDQQKALAALRRQQRDQLRVRAGMTGVLQQMVVEVGQQVQPGANLCRVADMTKLKAQIRIAETQLKDMAIGQVATIDTRNGIVPGHVIRIDPAAENGTVTVDVSLEGALPPGTRADMGVDGRIELERLLDVLYVQRPAFGQEKSTITLFKLEPDEKTAVRTQVTLGRHSVTHIEIVEGLKVGDKVILSDTSQWDNVDRIRLN